MKNKIFFAAGLLALAVFSVAGTAKAAVPTLSISIVSATQAQINATGNPNSNVDFYYNVGTASPQHVVLGVTDPSGVFSATVNTSVYNFASPSSVYVLINSQQSATQTWPTSGTTGGGSLVFSPSSLSISIGQAATFSVSGGSGYFVSSNSNTAVATNSINGNLITVTGISNGTATIMVCSSANGCGSVAVTVGSGSGSTGGVTFGIPNPSLAVGATLNMSLSGGSGYFVSSNSNAGVVSATVSGNALILSGVNTGTSVLSVCGSGIACSSLNVTVGAPSTTTTTTTTGTTTGTGSSQSLLAAIQSMQTQLVQILAQIQSMASTLTQLAASAGLNTSGTTTGGAVSSTHSFTQFLSLGSTGEEVTALQQKLSSLGMYSGPITGYFGSLTESAVNKYQAAHSIPVRGYVGPDTRSALNAD